MILWTSTSQTSMCLQITWNLTKYWLGSDSITLGGLRSCVLLISFQLMGYPGHRIKLRAARSSLLWKRNGLPKQPSFFSIKELWFHWSSNILNPKDDSCCRQASPVTRVLSAPHIHRWSNFGQWFVRRSLLHFLWWKSTFSGFLSSYFGLCHVRLCYRRLREPSWKHKVTKMTVKGHHTKEAEWTCEKTKAKIRGQQAMTHRPNEDHNLFFLNNVLLEQSHIHLFSIYGCLCATAAKMSSCNSDHMALTA